MREPRVPASLVLLAAVAVAVYLFEVAFPEEGTPTPIGGVYEVAPAIPGKWTPHPAWKKG